MSDADRMAGVEGRAGPGASACVASAEPPPPPPNTSRHGGGGLGSCHRWLRSTRPPSLKGLNVYARVGGGFLEFSETGGVGRGRCAAAAATSLGLSVGDSAATLFRPRPVPAPTVNDASESLSAGRLRRAAGGVAVRLCSGGGGPWGGT